MQRTKGMQISGNGKGSHPLREVGGHLSEQLVPWFVLDQVSYTGYVGSAVQASLRQPRYQPFRLHFQPYRLHIWGFH